MKITYEEAKKNLDILLRFETSPKLRQTYQIAFDAVDKAFIPRRMVYLKGHPRCDCGRKIDDTLWNHCPNCGQRIKR